MVVAEVAAVRRTARSVLTAVGTAVVAVARVEGQAQAGLVAAVDGGRLRCTCSRRPRSFRTAFSTRDSAEAVAQVAEEGKVDAKKGGESEPRNA